MKRLIVLILFVASSGVLADPFPNGDIRAGKKLFDDKKCDSCHIGKVGGDGSAIFTRPDRIVHNPQEMIARLHVCSGAIGMTLTEQNEQDLSAYLNQAYYKFK